MQEVSLVWWSLTISNERTKEWERFCGVGWTVDLWKLPLVTTVCWWATSSNIDKVASERVGNFSVTFHRPFHPHTCCPPCMLAGASKSVMGELSLARHYATMWLPFVFSSLSCPVHSFAESLKGKQDHELPIYFTVGKTAYLFLLSVSVNIRPPVNRSLNTRA